MVKSVLCEVSPFVHQNGQISVNVSHCNRCPLICPFSFHFSLSTTISLLRAIYRQTYTRSRCMYAYRTFNTHFRVLAQVLADVLGPTACSTRFSGKVFLISTVCACVSHDTYLPVSLQCVDAVPIQSSVYDSEHNMTAK